MLSSDRDTIAAIATPPGRGGIGIVRVSGTRVPLVIQQMFGALQPRYATHKKFLNAAQVLMDEGVALWFPAPHSFTGEDVLELQGHGSTIVLDGVLQHLFTLGVRLAQPGEFSQRAFLNNKIDLLQAEAIADLINASSVQAARAAMRSLQGDFSSQITTFKQALVQLRMYVEATIDFPEEDIEHASEIGVQLSVLQQHLHTLQKTAQQGVLLQEGVTVVIAGLPNVGKSSLLNQLSGEETAIVTAIPGTTRDIIRCHIQLEGLPIVVIDTAGLRASSDPVEQEGIRRAIAQMSKADHVLLIVDERYTPEMVEQLLRDYPALQQCPHTVVHNKIDLTGQAPHAEKNKDRAHIYVSAKTGAGLDALRTHVTRSMGYQGGAGDFSARRRHVDALTRVQQLLMQAQHTFTHSQAGELVAEDLRLAQQVLGEITGEFTADDLLGEIFSRFCIGK